ncbi:MAG TPA: chemotaxis protein CheW, partial [Tepidisphaeraceae bacterium]|nr:chemotaxis protein CheW [Tepidisphaeraceae bacterium]
NMSDTALLEKPETAARGGKYLTFALGKEEYGLEILKVREIIGYMDITAVPNTPPYVRGVINLRGQVISVVDLRTRFAMPSAEKTEQTCIIVVEIQSDGRRVCMGIVVDRVSEVLNIPGASIEDAPSFGTNIDTGFIMGMGKINGNVKILLDIDRVLSQQELTSIAAIGEANSTAKKQS